MILRAGLLVLSGAVAWAQAPAAPNVLPAEATTQLRASLRAAAAHKKHVWRDTPPFDGQLVNAYIEIPLGDRRKYEFDMAKNARVIDRVIPEAIGGYPVNYGIVPQTVSYDGDPFDALVLGPALPGGGLVKGAIVGLMRMEDETGLDSKVVLSRLGRDGRPMHDLTDSDRRRIGDYFNRYKRDDGDPKTFATVPGWGTAAIGRSFVQATHAFFKECRTHSGLPCEIPGSSPYPVFSPPWRQTGRPW